MFRTRPVCQQWRSKGRTFLASNNRKNLYQHVRLKLNADHLKIHTLVRKSDNQRCIGARAFEGPARRSCRESERWKSHLDFIPNWEELRYWRRRIHTYTESRWNQTCWMMRNCTRTQTDFILHSFKASASSAWHHPCLPAACEQHLSESALSVF